MTFTPGTLSHGTLREEDLAPTFLDALRGLDAEHAERLTNEYADALAALEQGLDHPDVEHLVPALFDALGEHAPPGYAFGAHDGDGTDFGFWLADDPVDVVEGYRYCGTTSETAIFEAIADAVQAADPGTEWQAALEQAQAALDTARQVMRELLDAAPAGVTQPHTDSSDDKEPNP